MLNRFSTQLSFRRYPKMLRLKEVLSITGLSRSTIYKLISDCQFPRQVHLSEKSVGWYDTEILNWVRDRIELRAPFRPKPTSFETTP